MVFRRRHRLGLKGEFGAVFDAKGRKTRGAITVFLLVTDRPEHRLGLSVGRRVGNAVVRGRFKRMIREVFRHQRLRFPVPSSGGRYDMVVTARGHDGLGLEEYTRLMVQAVEAAHRVYEKRVER